MIVTRVMPLVLEWIQDKRNRLNAYAL